jgi:hypothetical protein
MGDCHSYFDSAASLLHQEADRVGLVEQAQPAGFGRVLGVARVHEHAAAHQDAVRLGHHRGDPAHVEVLAARPGTAGQALIDVALDRQAPRSALFEALIANSCVSTRHLRMSGCAQHPLAQVRVRA